MQIRERWKTPPDYFVQIRKNKTYQPSKDEIRHVDELLKLMSVLTNDDRYVKVQTNGKGKVKNMCEAMDRAEEKSLVLWKTYNKQNIIMLWISTRQNDIIRALKHINGATK